MQTHAMHATCSHDKKNQLRIAGNDFYDGVYLISLLVLSPGALRILGSFFLQPKKKDSGVCGVFFISQRLGGHF